MNTIAAADAAEIVTLCNIAGVPHLAAGFINAGTSAAKVRTELQQRQVTQPAAAKAFQMFDRGLVLNIGEPFDLAGIEDAARQAGRLR